MKIKFVGIRNNLYKQRLLATGHPRQLVLNLDDLTYDCMRHLDFLKFYSQAGPEADFSRTLYWRYLVSFGRTAEETNAKCLHFAEQFESLRNQTAGQAFGRISVTEDGIRLDGSHRAVIFRFLGASAIEVDCYSWAELFLSIETRWIKLEADMKRELQAEYLGRQAYRCANGRYLGTVVFVDARPPVSAWRPWAWHKPGHLVPWMAVAEAGRPIQILPLKELKVS